MHLSPVCALVSNPTHNICFLRFCRNCKLANSWQIDYSHLVVVVVHYMHKTDRTDVRKNVNFFYILWQTCFCVRLSFVSYFIFIQKPWTSPFMADLDFWANLCTTSPSPCVCVPATIEKNNMSGLFPPFFLVVCFLFLFQSQTCLSLKCFHIFGLYLTPDAFNDLPLGRSDTWKSDDYSLCWDNDWYSLSDSFKPAVKCYMRKKHRRNQCYGTGQSQQLRWRGVLLDFHQSARMHSTDCYTCCYCVCVIVCVR